MVLSILPVPVGQRYEYLETISSGAYGVCYKVLDTVTGQHCAAKGIKQAHEDAEVCGNDCKIFRLAVEAKPTTIAAVTA